MPKRLHPRGWDTRPLILSLMAILLFLFLHLVQGSSPLAPSAFNSYTRQALQWRKGMMALDADLPWLELAVFEGRYYVSFPPVPGVPFYFLSFIFGEAVPDTLLVQGYALGAMLCAYALLKRRWGAGARAAGAAFLFCFSGALLPLLQNGAVWYQAQVLAFFLTLWALERADSGQMTPALLLYALSVGCRPFNALYLPLLLLLFAQKYPLQKHWRRLIPGLALGALVALALAWYNYARFRNPLEFGHNYLPEFSTQGGKQFSLDHLAGNFKRFILGSPFWLQENGEWRLDNYGFSFLISCPQFVIWGIWILKRALKRQAGAREAPAPALCALHCFLLLLHRTGGGFQFGARYFVDCLPYIAASLALSSAARGAVEAFGAGTETAGIETEKVDTGTEKADTGMETVNIETACESELQAPVLTGDRAGTKDGEAPSASLKPRPIKQSPGLGEGLAFLLLYAGLLFQIYGVIQVALPF